MILINFGKLNRVYLKVCDKKESKSLTFFRGVYLMDNF